MEYWKMVLLAAMSASLALSYTDSCCTSVLSPLSSFSPRISLWAAISSSDTDL